MNMSRIEAVPTVLDVEASGFGAGSYPIEVGFVTPDGQPHCSLIRPESDWTAWDPRAEAVHQVSRATLLEHGKQAEQVAHWLNGLLHGQTVYSDSWGHDYAWLALLFDVAGSRPAFRLESVRALLGDAELRLWHSTRDRVQVRMQLARHRASNDARVLQQTWLQVRRACAAGGLQ
ncbi:MAG: hypothetical protein ABI574_08905 [Burkholderiales bacterium]